MLYNADREKLGWGSSNRIKGKSQNTLESTLHHILH